MFYTYILKLSDMYQVLMILFSTLFLASPADVKDGIPSAMVKTIDGTEINIADYTGKGKIQIVSMWATWCGPCRMELNELDKVYAEWQDKYDVEIIAVTTDSRRGVVAAKKMFEDKGWNFTFMHDHKGELSRKLKITGIPYSMVIDQKGEVVAKNKGFSPKYVDNLEKKIKKLTK